ncbi:TlpA disulfide reductase family protein [Nafulsella turpanensis]|uniref:TlpA disulfide reductase family protein n=1 Tax=Nafulsella turpanensis TaxID=1265690 RepID=UPI00034B2706|nr:TlpA disulfide reductase family protein [Nafulsella turpanensis]
MNFRNLNVALLAMLAFASCSNGQSGQNPEEGEIVLQGKVENPLSGHIILEEIQGNQAVPVDTFALAEDQTFKETLDINEPGFYRLNFYGQQYAMLVLDNEDVTINANMNSSEPAKVEGSADTDDLEAINRLMRANMEKVKTLENEFLEARKSGDKIRMKELEQEYIALEQQQRDKLKDLMRQMESSISLVYGVNYLNREADFPFLDSLANRLQKDLPESKYVKDFAQGVESMRATVVGQVAPEISLPNPEGEIKKLSDLRGNIVMIDFWAAWCGPCRRENPNVVKLYNKYKDEGFEIYGVSLDRNKQDWVKAIEKDGLTWTQVSDLNYFNSEAAKTYNINAIPATVLLDKEGRIIARNLRGEALEKKLAELFGEE